MDKFTVDLEKVLDEFEYNEGREETVLPSVIRNHSCAHNSPRSMRPPAANYRRPAFEPISLADADFAAAPSSVSDQIIQISRQKTVKDPPSFNRNLNECLRQNPTSFGHFDAVGNQNCTSEVRDSLEILPTEQSASEQPDLLDSNSLNQYKSGEDSDPVVSINQLPDITSVRSVPPDFEVKKEVEVFDLIKPHRFPIQENTNDNELPPIVDVGSLIKEELPVVKLTPITFDSIDVSQSDLDNYLDNLEVNDNVGGEFCYDNNIDDDDCREDCVSHENQLDPDVTATDVITQPHSFSGSNFVEPEVQKSEEEFNSNVLVSENNNPCVQESTEFSVILSQPEPPDISNIQSSPAIEFSNSNSNNTVIGNNNGPTCPEIPIECVLENNTSVDLTSQTDGVLPEVDSEISNLSTPSGEALSKGLVEVEVICTNEQVMHSEVEIPGESIESEVELVADQDSAVCTEELAVENVYNESFLAGDLPLPAGDGSECETPSESSLPSTVTLESEINTSDEVLPGPAWTPDEAEPDLTTADGVSPENPPQSVDEIAQNLENLRQEACSLQDDQTSARPPRPSSLALPPHALTDSEESPTPSNSSSASVSAVMSPEERTLGKVAPYWVPDAESDQCMHCAVRFTVIKRRHHCRACGLVLCSKCCNLKAPLEYMENAEARVCQPCYNIIFRGLDEGRYNRGRQPNPNNPMEYCSTVPPPLQQPLGAAALPPPAVFVPTSVLKRQGSKNKSETPKQVMFSDGIRPGGDLTELDGSSETAPRLLPRRSFSRRMAPGHSGGEGSTSSSGRRPLEPSTQSWIPAGGGLPPTCDLVQGVVAFCDPPPSPTPIRYAINPNLTVRVGRAHLNCCVARQVWSVASEGLCLVGQDEVAIVLECLSDETQPPVDVFHLINFLWKQGTIGNTSSEMSFTQWPSGMLLGSNDNAGFLYIRPTLQCVTNLVLPAQPYLVAILVHRWEVPWARLFPLRLMLRLGAEYRYYPCTLVSVRNRQPLYTDIGRTIMKILVDFRKFSYSLATVRGLLIHVEDRQTTILFPRNRYDQVTRALNNSNESVLAFGANLSPIADSHLVSIQGTKDDETAYHTEAINIHNKPRRVTGASFVVFNGALKAASGLSGKSSIIEDGLMVHLPAERMAALRAALRSMHDFSISCGPNDEETVLLHWTDDDTNFNVGVRSCIDGRPLDGVPSIRVHNGTDYPHQGRMIRWTEVFIIQSEDSGKTGGEPLNISRVSESLSRATCSALAPLLDSLASAELTAIGVRATIHQDNVCYEAGSEEKRLPGNCMRRLDDELVPVLHQAALASPDSPAILELIFRIMNL